MVLQGWFCTESPWTPLSPLLLNVTFFESSVGTGMLQVKQCGRWRCLGFLKCCIDLLYTCEKGVPALSALETRTKWALKQRLGSGLLGLFFRFWVVCILFSLSSGFFSLSPLWTLNVHHLNGLYLSLQVTFTVPNVHYQKILCKAAFFSLQKQNYSKTNFFFQRKKCQQLLERMQPWSNKEDRTSVIKNISSSWNLLT